MTNKDIVTNMKREWNRLCPFIQSDNITAIAPLISIDKQFRSGPTHKLPAAFQIYDVR